VKIAIDRVERHSMAKQPSRREILGVAAAGLASVAVPTLATAQTPPTPTPTMETNFAKPLSPEAKRLLEEALKGIQNSSQERLKTKLPENSEPCFDYIVSPREVKKR